MSTKLKKIIEKHRNSGLQFFQTHIVHKSVTYPEFYSMNMFIEDNHFIDIKKSRVQYFKKADDYNITYMTNAENQYFESMAEFNKKKLEALSNNETFFIDKITLRTNIDEDFFMLRHVEGGVKYVVSKNLKKEIEDDGCTGIEFMPIELTINEWLHGEREQIYGKA